MIKLFYAHTPNALLTCQVARYLNLDIELIPVDLAKREQLQPAFLGINPNGKVPAMLDGQTALWEGKAICVYLCRRAGSDFFNDGEPLVDFIKWFSWDSEHFSRHLGTLFFEFVIKPYLKQPLDEAVVAEATDYFRKYARVLDGSLAATGWLIGDKVSLADFVISRYLPMADKLHLDLGEFPGIQDWLQRLGQIEAWRNPLPAAS